MGRKPKCTVEEKISAVEDYLNKDQRFIFFQQAACSMRTPSLCKGT